MITDKVSIFFGYGSSKGEEFLGYIPVFDPEYKACTYYSVENLHPEREFERVVPCYHFEVHDNWKTDAEHWFFKETLPTNERHDSVLTHAVLRDEFIERYNTMKYVVRFIGCDDGDKVMRFRDKEHALQYLNSVTYFEEVYDNEMLMEW